MSETTKDDKHKGVATLFDHIEIKKFIKFYIGMLCLLEIVIFFVCFFFQLEPINMPFPWRYYFLASFLAPIVITFLLGVLITAFNLFVFGDTQSTDPESIEKSDGKNKYINKFNVSLNVIRQAPFLLTLLVLGIGAIVFSQLDRFIILLGEIGVKAVQYALIILGVILAIATLFGFVWIIIRYKLEKMKYQYEYKRDVMTNLGMLMLDDNTMVNTDGKIVDHSKLKKIALKNTNSSENDPLLISQSDESNKNNQDSDA